MSERELGTILMVLAFFVIFGLPIIYLVRHRMKIKRVWRELAEKYNLTHHHGRFPAVSGTIENRAVEMGSGVGRTLSGRANPKQVVEFYAWTVINGRIPAGFAAGKRGMLQGKGPVQTDSKEFNKKIWVDCKDPEEGRTFLTPERQQALLELVKVDGVVYGANGEVPAHVSLNRSGYKVRLEWLSERMETMLKTARLFDANY